MSSLPILTRTALARPTQADDVVDILEQVRSTGARVHPGHAVAWRVAFFLGRLLKATLFVVLYWLRLPVLLVTRLISVPALFAWLFSMYAFPEHHAMVVTFGVMSFAAFALMFLYDSLLMWLSPADVVRVL